MRVEGSVVYTDDFDCGRNGEAYIGHSMKLDMSSKKVDYSELCNCFLGKIERVIRGRTDDNLVTVPVYRSISEFENIICRELLKLGYRGCFMDNACYEVPYSLTIEEFLGVYDFDKVCGLVDTLS